MEGSAMVVTPLYAGLLTLWYLLLSARVVHNRGRFKVSLGDGDNPELRLAIRAHANFAEYVPLALLLLLILELSRFSIYVTHLIGATLVLSRLLHGAAFAFGREWRFGRSAGIALTFLVLIVEAILCLYQAYRGHLIWFAT
jgi:uncharacterized membrane protein YecN with MAPEG domain